VKAAAAPVAGVWEGQEEGRKAVTLNVHEKDGILGGTVTFYIVRDNGRAELDGSALPALPLIGTSWDGRTLRFSLEVNGGAMLFELKITGMDQGELRIVKGQNSGHMTRVLRHK
jgi:hypothetical protein